MGGHQRGHNRKRKGKKRKENNEISTKMDTTMNKSRSLVLQEPKDKQIHILKWLAWSKTEGIVSHSLHREVEPPLLLCQF